MWFIALPICLSVHSAQAQATSRGQDVVGIAGRLAEWETLILMNFECNQRAVGSLSVCVLGRRRAEDACGRTCDRLLMETEGGMEGLSTGW